MRHGVKVVLFASSQTNANRLRDGITTRIPVGSTTVIAPRAAKYHDARFYAVASILAANALLADEFHLAIQTYWTTGTDATRALTGSESRRFQSFDDEPPESRVPDSVVERKAK